MDEIRHNFLIQDDAEEECVDEMRRKKKFNYTGDVHAVGLSSTIAAIGERTEYYYTGCGTFLRDWTWLDPREFDPALISIFDSYVQYMVSHAKA